MITIDNFVFDTLKRLDDLNIGNCLDIRSYKKNRKVIIEKLEDNYNLYEDGFYNEYYLYLSKEELKKLLKTIEKREFPRSNKLRFYILSSKDESACRANYREHMEEESTDERLNMHAELSYSLLSPIKSLVEEIDGEILKIFYAEIVSMEVSLPNKNLNALKGFIKDKTNIKIYSC